MEKREKHFNAGIDYNKAYIGFGFTIGGSSYGWGFQIDLLYWSFYVSWMS